MPKTILPSIKQIAEDFPTLGFKASEDFYFSARNKCVYYNKILISSEAGTFQLFHEIGHALSKHHHYESGIELLKMESEAWSKARKIAKQYELEIPEAIIERCLDSYRDWLHLRSVCPNCKNTSVETDANNYHCFNCFQNWSVPLDQRSRRYRHKLVHSEK
jgi:hypothetical protein